MFLHFNQYFRMTPQEALEDDKRVRKNQIEALLLTSIFGSLILTSRTQAQKHLCFTLRLSVRW